MRKLATTAAAFSAAVFIAHYLLPPDYMLPAAGVCLILSASAFFFRGNTRLRILLILLAAAAGFTAVRVSYARKTAPSVELAGKTATFCAEVSEYPSVYSGYSSVVIALKDAELPRVSALLYFSGNRVPELKPGDLLTITGKLKDAGQIFGEASDSRAAKGIYLTCYPDEFEVTGRSKLAFLYFPQDIRRAVAKAVLAVMPEDAAPFMMALLTGDNSLFYDDVQLSADMSSAGILHVISISGMHVAFLIGFLRLLVRRKKTAALICIPAVWIFAAVAGGSPSLIRAAFMQSVVLVAPLLRRESDGLTSLSAILAILLAVNPDACASISLQLSFSAMLGIILITPRVFASLVSRLHRPRRARRPRRADFGYKALVAVIASFSATIGAMAFSTPFIAWRFGTVAVYTIFANILIFWSISVCFILGYAACLLGAVWLPLGLGAGAVSGLIVDYIRGVSRLIAALPFSNLYATEGYFLFWLLFSYAVFGAWFLMRRGKKGFRPIVPTALVLCALFVGVILVQISAKNAPPSFTAVDIGQGQSLVISQGGTVAVIDCGGRGTITNAGDTVSRFLLRQGISVVDALCITHFHDDHVNGAMRLMASVRVKHLFIAPVGEAAAVRAEVIAFAEKHGVQVHVVEENTVISLGEMTITAFKPVSRLVPELIFLASLGDYDILMTGDAYEDTERRLLMVQDLPDIEIFVAGHHGSKNSSSEVFLEAIGAEIAVISCGYNNYGHPSDEALERFEAAGMEIRRTDLEGNVTILLPAS